MPTNNSAIVKAWWQDAITSEWDWNKFHVKLSTICCRFVESLSLSLWTCYPVMDSHEVDAFPCKRNPYVQRISWDMHSVVIHNLPLWLYHDFNTLCQLFSRSDPGRYGNKSISNHNKAQQSANRVLVFLQCTVPVGDHINLSCQVWCIHCKSPDYVFKFAKGIVLSSVSFSDFVMIPQVAMRSEEDNE